MVRRTSSEVIGEYGRGGVLCLLSCLFLDACHSREERLHEVMGHNQKALFDLQSHAGDPIEPEEIRKDLEAIDRGLASLRGDEAFQRDLVRSRRVLQSLLGTTWTKDNRRELFGKLKMMCATCHVKYPPTRILPKLPFDHTTITSQPSLKACGSCHQQVVEEWKNTLHARAWVDPVYRMSAGNPPAKHCRSCHIPEPILLSAFDVSYGFRPFTRSVNLAEGVNCASCHLRADGHVAAGRTVDAPCRPKQDRRIRSAKFCGSCHNPTHDAYFEWASSRAARNRVSCIDCHMQPVKRPNGRMGWSHKFAGGNDPAMVRKAIRWECRIDGDRLLIRIENRTSHKFPGEVPSRIFHVIIQYDEEEVDLRFRRPNKKEIGWKDNRLKPDETRVIRWKIPPGTKSLVVRFQFQQSPFMMPRGWIDLGSWKKEF